MINSQVCLGDKVKDSISGYTGTVVAITTWIAGCKRITIQGKVDKDGKIPETQTMDEPNLIVIKSKLSPTKLSPTRTKSTGGDQPKVGHRANGGTH